MSNPHDFTDEARRFQDRDLIKRIINILRVLHRDQKVLIERGDLARLCVLARCTVERDGRL